MTRIGWWFVDRVSRMLEPGERDAVLGDFAESGLTAAPALRDLLGLIIRRQAALWKDWRPWLALLLVVAPFGILLSLICRYLAEGSATTFYLYVNAWTWGFLESPGARRDLAHYSADIFRSFSTLVCWSWTTGFVIGSLARRTIWVNGTLFTIVLFGELLAGPHHHNPFNPLVFSLTFYRAVLPPLLCTVLIFLPALWGMHKAFRLANLPPLRTILWAAAIATMTGLAIRDLEVSVMSALMSALWPLRAGWGLRLLPLAAVCPAGFMVATAKWRRLSGKVMGCALIFCIVTAIPVLAKTYTANVPGVITNPNGRRVVNAAVAARNQSTNVVYHAASDRWGTFTFTELPLGTYDLTVDAQGFKEAVRKNVLLWIGGTGEQEFSLKKAEGTQSVSGQSGRPIAQHSP